MARLPARRFLPLIFWLLALMGLWLLFVVSTALPELAVGACSAILTTIAVAFIHRHVGSVAPPRLRWLLGSWRLLPRLFTESAVVFGALYRQIIGREPPRDAFRAVPYAGVYDSAGAALAGDAFVIGANSLTPNSIVLDIDRVEGLILLHQLVPQPDETVRGQVVQPR